GPARHRLRHHEPGEHQLRRTGRLGLRHIARPERAAPRHLRRVRQCGDRLGRVRAAHQASDIPRAQVSGCPVLPGERLVEGARFPHSAGGPLQMDLLITVRDFWLNRLAWLAGLAVVFGLLARLAPGNREMYWWKDLRSTCTDLFYWFVPPLFMQVCR